MFIVCQIGAREHYAIARSLHAKGELGALLTDFLLPPGHWIGRIPGAARMKDRWHPGLAGSRAYAPNLRMLSFELRRRLWRQSGWSATLARNILFERWACRLLGGMSLIDWHSCKQATEQPYERGQAITLFSYSYAARDLFRLAKARGWKTVLGQIDPGPEEERIVAEEHRRYPGLAPHWQAAPGSYWQRWREELELADRILVNSEWSRQCLLKEQVPSAKLEIVPLVYNDRTASPPRSSDSTVKAAIEPTAEYAQGFALDSLGSKPRAANFKLLFLGQVILRKGVGRLLDAMRLMKDEPVELILAGPSEIDVSAWADLPKVRWLGPVARSECARLYRESDCFILPTLSDGYALTQLEALSHGVPVIASRHCGEAVREGANGWILPDLEPSDLAAAVRLAMNSRPSDIRPPGFSMDDLASVLLAMAR
jgi:glycosyltransferase involved in cell wall biosynthesis